MCSSGKNNIRAKSSLEMPTKTGKFEITIPLTDVAGATFEPTPHGEKAYCARCLSYCGDWISGLQQGFLGN